MRKSLSGGLLGLSGLSAVGSLLISLPLSYNDGSDIISLLISSAFSFMLIIFFYPVAVKFFGSDFPSNKVLRFLKIFVFIFLETVLIIIAVTTICDLSSFTKRVVLPEVNLGFILTVFGIVGFIIGTGKISALSKTATVSLLAVAVLSVVIFAFSVPDMSFKYIKPRESFDMFSALKTSLSFFLSSFAPGFVLVSVIGGKISDKRSVMIGSAVGGAIILLAVLNTLLVFGGEFSGELSYPYVSAVKTVGEKDVFSGMEGFLYFTVFLSSIIKTALAFCGIKLLSKEIYEIKKF